MNGFFYVATGSNYYDEALFSAKTLKESNSGVSIAIATDSMEVNDLFDIKIPIKSCGNGYLDKIRWMRESPFDNTIFLDTDTYIAGDLSPIFYVLQKFDLVVCQAPFREIFSIPNIPISFPEMNTGMIAYKRGTEDFFFKWEETHSKKYLPLKLHDQPAFRETLYKSTVKFLITIEEYNCRFRMGFAQQKVIVLHDRHQNIKKIEGKINEFPFTKRLFRLNGNRFEIFYPQQYDSYLYNVIMRFKLFIKAVLNKD